MAYYQDTFDKWFSKIVNYLLATRAKHKKFKNLADLSKMLGLGKSGANLSAIKNGLRGVPKDKRTPIERIITKEFGIKPNANVDFEMQDFEAPYITKSAETKISHLSQLLEKEERHTAFLQDVYENYLKTITISLDSVAANQRIMLAQLNVESYLAAERHAGGDPDLLKAELQKRDKLIGAVQS